MKILYIFYIIAICLSITRCQYKGRKSDSPIDITKKNLVKYAKGFKIYKHSGYTELIIKSDFPRSSNYFKYILKPKSNKEKIIKKGYQLIQTPISSIVPTSNTHVAMIEKLGAQNSIVGFPNLSYISSLKTRALIEQGKISDLGLNQNINSEILLELFPSVFMGFTIGDQNKELQKIQNIGIPVVINNDWLEQTPLGRAEWLKVIGLLFDKEEKANLYFENIEKNYIEAKKLVLDKCNKPTALTGAILNDHWFVPKGDSYFANFLKDAGIDYLWKNTKGTGSISLNFELVLDRAQHADIWIAPSGFENKKQMIKQDQKYTYFDSFRTGNLYTYVNKKGLTGGILYFEESPIYPDLILKDLIKIAHPEVLPNYSSVFFSKMQ